MYYGQMQYSVRYKTKGGGHSTSYPGDGTYKRVLFYGRKKVAEDSSFHHFTAPAKVNKFARQQGKPVFRYRDSKGHFSTSRKAKTVDILEGKRAVLKNAKVDIIPNYLFAEKEGVLFFPDRDGYVDHITAHYLYIISATEMGHQQVADLWGKKDYDEFVKLIPIIKKEIEYNLRMNNEVRKQEKLTRRSDNQIIPAEFQPG